MSLIVYKQAISVMGAFFIFCLASVALSNQPASSVELMRYRTLIQEVRCVVCQGQNIADSHAPLAADLRQKIYAMIMAHQSDEAIKAYLVKRYGEFILLRPRVTAKTLVLWAFPWVGLFGMAVIMRRIMIQYTA